MKKIFTLVLLVACSLATGQSSKSIELSLLGRYDKHADYSFHFAGRVRPDYTRLYGLSYGASGVYRQKIRRSFFVYTGLGFYQLRINKVRQNSIFNQPGERTGRNIDYLSEDSTKPLYATGKYHYNNIAITLGLEKELRIKPSFKFDLGAELVLYKTFSQKYKLGPSLSYKTHHSKPLEFGINTTIGFTRQFNHLYLKPGILIPVFQNLKGDKAFTEDLNMNISKWFNGMGAFLKFGKFL